MKKNLNILMALLMMATAATAQKKALISTSRSNIKHASLATDKSNSVTPVKQEQAIVTTRSNIKHQSPATDNSPSVTPVKQAATAVKKK